MNTPVGEISFIFAFLAGVVSFISPCILPLIPGYITMVSKQSFEEIKEGTTERKVRQILFPSILFILGFSTVFVILGVSASFIGGFIARNKLLLLQISGGIIILFGLFAMELLKIPQLYRERRISLPQGNFGLIGTYFLGIAFGFGWTPCVGPILASILLYASTAEGAEEGAALLFTYSAGLGLPFLLTGLALSRALTAFNWIKRHYGFYKFTVGGTLIVVGILMVTNNLYYLNIYGQRVFDLAGLNFWQSF
ncbi:MAG: cytochrome c biogenesis CcdA family protein [Thermodesulfobacteriota bacterium]